MKKVILILSAAVLLTSCGSKAPKLADRTDTLSWAMGENLALSLQSNNFMKFNNDVVLEAIRHTLDGGQQPISDEEMQAAMQFIAQNAALAQMQETNTQREQMKRAQDEYFAKLEAENPNVKKHKSGFYYEQLRAGKGRKAPYAHRINFDYKGILMLTGEVFDQTYGVRTPITTVLGNPMFPGLQEAFQLMNKGSQYRFYFPWQLAFGERGTENVPPYTPVIYEVELHDIYDD
ncbi:MAG: FKBP-type peptidyl-prolyl cis-trans isomerase [Bacteroidales bacterium]|nr:FKBP-type peptidyl-prolyl cis-trans isomerase [Bacteroidales bacterium]